MRKFIRKVAAILVYILLALFTCLFAKLLFPVQTDPAVLSLIDRNVVRLHYFIKFTDIYENECQTMSIGSAVFIGKNRALSVMHIAKGKSSGELFAFVNDGNDGKVKVNFRVMDVDPKNDLILLESSEKIKFQVTRLAKQIIPGEQIIFAGYNFGEFPKIRFHFLSENTKAEKLEMNGYFLHPIFYGDSGGGVFNLKGELIGIIRTLIFIKEDKLTSNTFMGYAVPLLEIKTFLEGK